MSIRINSDKCTGCGGCTHICPGNLIKREEGGRKAIMAYPDRCWGCAACVKECSFSAIEYFLGADIGGNGGSMHIKKNKTNDELCWVITSADGKTEEITINRKDSNKY